MVEPLGNSVQVPYTPCSHCVDEVREGSVQSNHSELTSKTSTHLTLHTFLSLISSTYIMHSALDTIGPGGWGQRPQSEPA